MSGDFSISICFIIEEISEFLPDRQEKPFFDILESTNVPGPMELENFSFSVCFRNELELISVDMGFESMINHH